MTPHFLDVSDVLVIHETSIALYGGATGVRDLGLPSSALAQPQSSFGEEYLHGDLYEMAAAYLFHIAKNHPFVDGSKRTALADCLVFLDLNNVEVDIDPLLVENLTVSVAEGATDKAGIAKFLREHCTPPG